MRPLVFLTASLLVACSSAPPATFGPAEDLSTVGGDQSDDLATSAPFDLALADFATIPDLNSPYPPGPYGSNVGDTIAPLVWEGYVNPSANGIASSAPYTQLAMNDLRKSGNKFALLYAADFW